MGSDIFASSLCQDKVFTKQLANITPKRYETTSLTTLFHLKLWKMISGIKPQSAVAKLIIGLYGPCGLISAPSKSPIKQAAKAQLAPNI